jgi:hypothetical protein
MQTYANLCLLGAVSIYCFTDTGSKSFGKIAKWAAIAMLGAFVVTEAIALIA